MSSSIIEEIHADLSRWCFFISLAIVHCFGAKDSLQSLDPITVTSVRPTTSMVDQKKIEQAIGIVEDLNTVLLQKPGVQSVPEAGSLLLVNGDGPFDNLYLVRGIPVFPPANFAGHTFADRSVVTLALPNVLSLTASDISGQWSGASGSVIGIDPCILKTANRLRRPEAAASFGTLSTDFSLSVPVRRARDRYQLSFYVPISYALNLKSFYAGESSDLGYGIPASAWNFRALGEQSTKTVQFRQLLWAGINTYARDFSEALRIQQGSTPTFNKPNSGRPTGGRFPWGIASFSAHDSLAARPWKITFGGSRQNYFEAKALGALSACKSIERNNAALSAQCDVFKNTTSSADIRVLGEYLFWKGVCAVRSDDSADTIVDRNRKNGNVQIHIGYMKSLSNVQLRINSNQGFFNSGRVFFLDPGVSVAFPAFHGNMEFSAGVTSAPADIRGLPGNNLDRLLSHSYQAHLAEKWKIVDNLICNVGVFFKYKDRLFLYEDSPTSLFWDADRKASSAAAGGSCQIELKVGKILALNTNACVSRAKVVEQHRNCYSDWDIPFATATSVSIALIPDKMTIYCIGNFSTGRPYRDLLVADSVLAWAPDQSRLPKYKCVDLKWEWRQPTDGHFFTEYDAFMLLQNVFNYNNVREYQWKPRKYPISLSPLTFHMGMRVNFRFLYW